MTQAIIHVRCNATGKIQRVTREGRSTIILPSFAAKADTVLNGILYPKDELQKSISGLNRTPAPLGHPKINGKFVPALDPEALARNHVFAWNENARWVGDRIALDVVIDEARAGESEAGKSVLNAIEKQEPMSTSTGLLCELEGVSGKNYESIARNIQWDHVALLMDEEPAISTNEGVGIFVNSKDSGGAEIEVINSSLSDEADRELNWAVESLARAMDRQERVTVLERMKTAILDAIGIGREPNLNVKENEMADENQVKDLSERVNALSEAMEKSQASLGETIANAVTAALKPVLDAQAEITANAKAKDEAELAGHVATIVKANILDEESAKELTLNAARKLAAKAVPGKAAALNGAFTTNADDEFAGVDLNAGMEAK